MNEQHVADLPLYPFTECPDERTAGVLLLEWDDECKTTADRYGRGWRVVEWEVHDLDGAPHWFARCWSVIDSSHVSKLAAGLSSCDHTWVTDNFGPTKCARCNESALASTQAAPDGGLDRLEGLAFYLHENPDSSEDEAPVRLVMAMSIGDDVFCHRATQGDNGIFQPASTQGQPAAQEAVAVRWRLRGDTWGWNVNALPDFDPKRCPKLIEHEYLYTQPAAQGGGQREGYDDGSGRVRDWSAPASGDGVMVSRAKLKLWRNLIDAAPSEVQSDITDVLSSPTGDNLQAFKDYVHQRLDAMGVPVDPESPHKAAGCRIGGRLDYVEARLSSPTGVDEAMTRWADIARNGLWSDWLREAESLRDYFAALAAQDGAK